MSRSGYCEDIDQWDLIRWRGAVASAIRGKRGQAFLREMLEALEALPEQRLIYGQLTRQKPDSDVFTFPPRFRGSHAIGVCALGSVGEQRGLNMTGVDPEDAEAVAALLEIAPALAKEIAWVNDDEPILTETPEERFRRVREWVVKNIATQTEIAS